VDGEELELREVLERSRLSLLTLFRALDRLELAQEIPPELHMLFELDADLAEALWVLDQPPGRYDLSAMTADTIASLRAIPDALRAFFALLSEPAQAELSVCADAVRATLSPSDAYLQIPGRDPAVPAKR
jgi:hypothetical protein